MGNIVTCFYPSILAYSSLTPAGYSTTLSFPILTLPILSYPFLTYPGFPVGRHLVYQWRRFLYSHARRYSGQVSFREKQRKLTPDFPDVSFLARNQNGAVPVANCTRLKTRAVFHAFFGLSGLGGIRIPRRSMAHPVREKRAFLSRALPHFFGAAAAAVQAFGTNGAKRCHVQSSSVRFYVLSLPQKFNIGIYGSQQWEPAFPTGERRLGNDPCTPELRNAPV